MNICSDLEELQLLCSSYCCPCWLRRMLSHSPGKVPSTWQYHYLRDCCRVWYQCFQKGRAIIHSVEKLLGTHSKGCLCCCHSYVRLHEPAIWASTLLPRWISAANSELLWLHEYQGTSRHSFAVADGRSTQGTGRCGLELQTRAWPPHKSVSSHCPQRLCGCQCFTAEAGLQSTERLPLLHMQTVSWVITSPGQLSSTFLLYSYW